MSAIEEIKERLDLTEYIGKHIQLQKSGRNFRGLCPFHTEKTPSFFVFPESERWHCFGCGRGGDLFTFAMEHQGLDFRSALEELARLAGVQLIPLTPERVQEESETERLHAVLKEAAEYYYTLLLTAPQARACRAYLRERGFKRGTVDAFKVGYSLESWDALRTHLLAKGFTVQELVRAGMLVEKEEGGTYDRFRNRLMIPICDRRGEVVGFGGRILNPEDNPKYMNSPQTSLFDKSQLLYGYHLASQAIRTADEAIIVEGYMDVMIAHQAGYKNVVAPMGTALTEAHLKHLQRLTRRFTLALDPDTAGVHGTLQGLETARTTLDREWQAVFNARGLVGYEGRLKAEIRVILLPEGKDPDEIILADPKKWEALVAGSQPIVRFVFQHLMTQVDPSEPKAKATIVDTMLPLLNDIENATEREAYAQEIAGRLGLNPHFLLDRLRAKERTEAVRQQASVKSPEATTPAIDLERYALTLLIKHPSLLEGANHQLNEQGLTDIVERDFSAVLRMIWAAWMRIVEAPQTEWQDYLSDDMLAQVRQLESVELPETRHEQLVRELVRSITLIREKNLRGLIEEVQRMISEAQTAGDSAATQLHVKTLQGLLEDLKRVHRSLAWRPGNV